VSRDRQRAKQRRKRQAQGAGRPGPRSAAAREREAAARDVGLDDAGVEDAGLGEPTPPPLDPQPGSSMFPGLSGPPAGVPVPDDDEEFDEGEDYEPAPDEVEGDLVPAGRLDPAVAEAAAEAHGPPVRRRQRGRVFTFLGHCWDELRRVQWPDRRQVGQATAVVLGFIVVAGGYLGLLDALWKPLVDAIL